MDFWQGGKQNGRCEQWAFVIRCCLNFMLCRSLKRWARGTSITGISRFLSSQSSSVDQVGKWLNGRRTHSGLSCQLAERRKSCNRVVNFSAFEMSSMWYYFALLWLSCSHSFWNFFGRCKWSIKFELHAWCCSILCIVVQIMRVLAVALMLLEDLECWSVVFSYPWIRVI